MLGFLKYVEAAEKEQNILYVFFRMKRWSMKTLSISLKQRIGLIGKLALTMLA
jgi:hypothetical protein